MHLTSKVLLGACTVRMSFVACRGLVFFNLVVFTLASMSNHDGLQWGVGCADGILFT